VLYVNWTLSRRPFYSDKCCTPVIHSADILRIYTTINFTRLSVTTEVGALSAAGWVWSTQATVSSARGWLGVVVAQKADLNWKL